MEELSEMYTPSAVEALINEIERFMPGLRQKAEEGHFTSAERVKDPKLNAMCNALERLEELKSEIELGLREPNGDLNVGRV
ncbi:MAG: hypothetical protein Q8L52_00945 [bacterium]|nr:hypothetical protein [bacterium]